MPRLKTNEEAQVRRSRIIKLIFGGKSPKEVAYDEGMAPTTVYRIAWEEGFHRQYIQNKEWEMILKQRKAQSCTPNHR